MQAGAEVVEQQREAERELGVGDVRDVREVADECRRGLRVEVERSRITIEYGLRGVNIL